MKHTSNRFRRWEAALLAGVAVAALFGARLDRQQTALADKVVRLHVLANSDTKADQSLKLQVRDAVLQAADGLIQPGYSLAQAETAITQALPDLAAAGAEVVGEQGYSYPVTASLEHDVWFPTKEYTDFSFPAGTYTSLRVVIGEGDGKNWWCVVFPPLCLGSVTETTAETALEGGLDAKEVALITGEDQGYVVKFKAMELLEEFKGWMGGN